MTDDTTGDTTDDTTDDMTDDTSTPETDAQTLKDVSHTNPYTDESFARTQVYHRGRTIAADGGRDPSREPPTGESAEDADAEAEESDPEQGQLKDVDHTPPKDAESANRVHQRGHEGRDESV